jgi:hypothetical protein
VKTLLVIATVLAAIWVWNHHTATSDELCLTAPRQVCLEHSASTTTTTRTTY